MNKTSVKDCDKNYEILPKTRYKLIKNTNNSEVKTNLMNTV